MNAKQNSQQAANPPQVLNGTAIGRGARAAGDRIATLVLREFPKTGIDPTRLSDLVAEFVSREIFPALVTADSVCSIIAHRGCDKQSEQECSLASRVIRCVLEGK
jgi:hypothetical protein